MHWLETKIPPPVVMLLFGASAWGLTHLVAGPSFELPLGTLAATAIASAGLALNVLPKFAFRLAGTTVNPLRPDASTRLVTSGLYRFTRNPMYLGHTMLLLAWSVHWGDAVSLAAIPAYWLYVSRFQIEPEERLLLARFQDEYVAFCRRTRRWL